MKQNAIYVNSRFVKTANGDRAVLEFVPLNHPYACKAFINPSYKDVQGKVIDKLGALKPFDRICVEYSYKFSKEKGYRYYVYAIYPYDETLS